MDALEIKIELLRRRIKMADVGRQLGVSQTAVQRVIERDMVSERIMRHIAELICMPADSVFPEREFNNQPDLICRNQNISQH